MDDATELMRATTDELAVEIRKAIRGRAGYRSQWPPVRTTRQGRAARVRGHRKATMQGWRVKVGKRQWKPDGSYIALTNKEPLAWMLERAPKIRGRPNRHFESAFETVREQWGIMAQIAMGRAPARVRTNKIRRIKGQDAAARRTAGYSRFYGKQG